MERKHPLIPGVPEKKQNPRAWREHSLPAERAWFEATKNQRFTLACDPLAEVYPLREHIYAIFNRCPDGSADSWAYLILGESKALLLDTGFGLGDLKALVEALAGERELLVVNSHCHGDHTLGNSQFARVYAHHLDISSLQHQMTPGFWQEFCIGDRPKERIKPFFTDADRIPFGTYELIPFDDGTVFDLGGVTVEAIWTPGHSAGCCVFLAREDRILFSSDTITSIHASMADIEPYQPTPQYITLQAFRASLAKLVARKEEYDFLCPAHGRLSVEKKIVEQMLTAVEAVLQDKNDCDYMMLHNGKVEKKKICGLAVLSYKDERFADWWDRMF